MKLSLIKEKSYSFALEISDCIKPYSNKMSLFCPSNYLKQARVLVLMLKGHYLKPKTQNQPKDETHI